MTVEQGDTDTDRHNGMVALGDFAKELGLEKSGVRKSILTMEKQHGRSFLKRGRVRDNQRGWILSRDDANLIKQIRERDGFSCRTKSNDGTLITAPQGQPTVYLLDISGSRVKLGYSDAFATRLTAHRTLVPDLRVLRDWPLPQAYEMVMIGIARNHAGLKEIGPEVFQYANHLQRDDFISKLDGLAEIVGLVRSDPGAA